jgi:hypothetical protein
MLSKEITVRLKLEIAGAFYIGKNAELLIHTRRDFVNRFLKGDRFIWDNVKPCKLLVSSGGKIYKLSE